MSDPSSCKGIALTEQFSDQHPFSRTQIEEGAALVADETKRKRWWSGVTMGYRRLAQRQYMANQLAYIATVATVFVAELFEQDVSRLRLYVWLFVAVAMFFVRLAMYRKIFGAAPAEIARSWVLRSMPAAMVVTAAAFWGLSTFLFIGPALHLSALLLIVGYLALSIPMVGMFPSVPIPSSLYLATLWGSVFVRLLQLPSVPLFMVGLLAILVTTTLWAGVFVPVLQVRSHLDRSDRIDLLVAQLQDANRSLEVMQDELMGTNRKRLTFFAAASHDFRQRLHAMKLMTDSTATGLQGDEAARQPIRRLSAEVENLERYMSDVLDFARIEALDEKPQLRIVDLQRLFHALDLQFEGSAQQQRVAIKIRETHVVLETDSAMLQRVLENLLSNALKFRATRVLVAARRVQGEVLIEVWDNGAGIEAEYQAKIFEAFHQDLRVEPNGRRGVGIGLAVVRRFVDSLGYRVTVQSNPGRGSVFRVHIPDGAVLSAT